MEPKTIADRIELNNGVRMPWLGLGVFQMTGPSEAENAVSWAIEAGYRAIDTAAAYGNEEDVGRGIRMSPVPREELFLTTKVWNADLRSGKVREAFEASLKRLGTDYIDLYLIHWPVPNCYKAAWDILQTLYSEGRIRAIGVSNFMEEHLDDIITDVGVVPAVNQIEYHPRLVQPKLMDYCRERNIRITAWSPLMQGGVFQIPEIGRVAEKHGRTVVQIVLRWNLQNGVIVIPKSSRRDRIRDNGDIFDFHLDEQDMAVLNGLNTAERTGPDPRNFNF